MNVIMICEFADYVNYSGASVIIVDVLREA